MNWRFLHAVPISLCLLAVLVLCPSAHATTIVCWPDAAADNTGSVYGPTPLSSEIVAYRTPRTGSQQNYYHEVGYARFNISAVSDTEPVSSVTVHFYVNDSSGHARFRLTPLEFDPLVTSDLWIRWDITTDSYYSHFALCTDIAGTGWYGVDLGPRGVEYLTSMLDDDWFGIGFHNLESGIRADGWAETNTPYLVVNDHVDPVTIHVDDDGPFDPGPGDPTLSDPEEDGSPAHPFDSIQKAIEAVDWRWYGESDIVLVADGTYTGEGNRDITFSGKRVDVRSANGPETCVIDCQGSIAEPHRGFNVLGEGTIIEGFTISGGYSTAGGGIYVRWNSSPVISGNIILDNEASYTGGGIWFGGGTITGNRISGNTAVTGGGIYVKYQADGGITNNLIYGNTATSNGGGMYIWSNRIDLVNNAIFDNLAVDGGGIYRDGYSNLDILNCTVIGNTAIGGGGGLYLYPHSTVIDCIIHGNEAATGNDIYFDWATYNVFYSNTGNALGDIYEDPDATVNWGAGMIHTNPDFATGAGGDYYLSQLAAGQPVNSACIDNGSGPANGIQIPLSWDVTTGATTWMLISERTTATNFNEDTGTVDMGFHYPALSTVSSRLNTVPSAGILPFGTRITATLENNYSDQIRRMAARLDALLADGDSYTNWRSGWANIAAGSNYTTSWMQSIPALSALVGENRFTLHAWDITPAPYNQPPYPADGDSDSDTSVVTGIAP